MTTYTVFKISQLDEGLIMKVAINRPKALNAMNSAFFEQLKQIFKAVNQSPNVRAVILLAEGRMFTAGLDLKQFGSFFMPTQEDSARQAVKIYDAILKMQNQFLSIVQSRVPVIVGVHGLCLGGGMDLISMADIRYCSADAQFSIKEIDIGMAADLGTLQFLPNLMGNESAVREMAYTGRMVPASEALALGFISKVFPDRSALQNGLLETARIIASKSPVGIYTLKQVFKREQSKKVREGLEYMARTNSAMLQTKDMMEAIGASFRKQKGVFPKL